MAIKLNGNLRPGHHSLSLAALSQEDGGFTSRVSVAGAALLIPTDMYLPPEPPHSI
jgi:hypothetical protein